jgi:HD-GYP domain-containing protein (c-di-GMP phosphodiesterase class II)
MTILIGLMTLIIMTLTVLLYLSVKRIRRVTGKLNLTRLYLEESDQGYHSYARIGKLIVKGEGIYELLEMILDESQRLSNADGGTLYLFDNNKENLIFTIMHTNSLGIRQGGTSGNEIKLPPVPLFKDGQPNMNNVCSSCAHSEETINIPDVYKAEGFDFSGTRKYDSSTGYRSRSMLVMPMKDLDGKMIGVIQLLNARNKKTQKPVSFSSNHENLISFLTAHAASTLTNVQLTDQLKELFNAFIRSIASSIDEKSPYTGDHIRRVVSLTMMIAQAVNEATEGPFKDSFFSEDELEELRLSAWLHDIGKLTTPDGLVNKSTKLELFEDRIELIELRFQLVEELCENEDQKQQIRGEADFVMSCNQPSEFMDDYRMERLQEIGRKTYHYKGKDYPYLTEEELEHLSIRKGTLTAKERGMMENHVSMTRKILNELPFPENLAHVPQYAAMHHEKLNGKGYPDQLKAEDLPLQARIIAVSDIFEALTAKDRPYRKPIGWTRALEIIKNMVNDNELDDRLHEILFSSGVAEEYVKKELF